MAIGTALAILGSAIIGAAVSKSSSDKAIKASSQAASANNELSREIYQENKSVLSPYIDQGVENSGRVNALLKTNPYDFSESDFHADPGYQFRLNQGLQAVTQSKAVGGLLKSGSALKALNDYAQGQASQEYGAAYNRHQTSTGNYVNALQNQQGAGLTAGSALAGVGQNYSGNVSANNNNAANNAGNAALAGASSFNNLLGQGVNALSYANGNGGFGSGRGSSYTPAGTYAGNSGQYAYGNPEPIKY